MDVPVPVSYTHLDVYKRQYLTYLRILHARELLAQTDRIQFDVGRSCGFYDTAYFQRVFKKMTGVLPGEFRRESGMTCMEIS